MEAPEDSNSNGFQVQAMINTRDALLNAMTGGIPDLVQMQRNQNHPHNLGGDESRNLTSEIPIMAAPNFPQDAEISTLLLHSGFEFRFLCIET